MQGAAEVGVGAGRVDGRDIAVRIVACLRLCGGDDDGEEKDEMQGAYEQRHDGYSPGGVLLIPRRDAFLEFASTQPVVMEDSTVRVTR